MDLYNLLGVKHTARPEEIRTAFRRLAKRAHPDAHPHLSGPEKVAMHRQFIQLAQAYETLSDPARRHAYDREIRAGRKASTATDASATRKPGRRTAQGTGPRRTSARRRPPPPPPPPPGGDETADLDSLRAEVQELLDKFGIDMRQQFGEILDKALDWALSVFVEVVTALEGNKAAKEAPEAPRPPREEASAKSAASEDPPKTKPPPKPPPRPKPPPPNLDDELAALKQQVRTSGERGRAPSPETVEEALQQIKNREGRKS